MDVLAHPFRLTSTGEVALVEQGGDAHLAQQAYQFVSTRPRELPLTGGYGLEDPAFRIVDPGEIAVGLAMYHPDIRIEEVTVYETDGYGTTAIDLAFSVQTQTVVVPSASVVFNA